SPPDTKRRRETTSPPSSSYLPASGCELMSPLPRPGRNPAAASRPGHCLCPAMRSLCAGANTYSTGMSINPNGSEGWRVGVLFSRGGLSALTESEHLRGTILAIEEINRVGGVRGRALEPVFRDPQSSPATYRQMARQLIVDEGVTTIFGCSHSASRKAVLPLVERHDALLFYPSVYEGFEYSENVIYAGATLNQCAFALADFLIRHYGKRIGFVGADYIFP